MLSEGRPNEFHKRWFELKVCSGFRGGIPVDLLRYLRFCRRASSCDGCFAGGSFHFEFLAVCSARPLMRVRNSTS
jgi:hypothetical protein